MSSNICFRDEKDSISLKTSSVRMQERFGFRFPTRTHVEEEWAPDPDRMYFVAPAKPIRRTRRSAGVPPKKIAESADSHWIEHNRFLRNSIGMLDFLRGEELITPQVREKAEILLEILYSENTVPVSSISPEDDGGVAIYWVAGEKQIEIDVEPDGSYWWGVRGASGKLHTGYGKVPPISGIKRAVDALSAYVEQKNPRWRNVAG